jgi:ribokinase
MDKADLLTVGDVNLDVFVTPLESEAECRLDSKESFICFSYGDKIPVKNLEFCVGGNAANNAVGVKRLGLSPQLVLTLGDDEIGNMIVDRLGKDDLDETYIFRQAATGSNYNTVVNYSGERTIFTYHAPRSYEFPTIYPRVSWVYLTSMGESFRPFYVHFIDWLAKNPDVKVVYNPGSWQLRLPEDGIDNVLPHVYMIYVNRKEAEKITGFGPSEDKEKELLTALGKKGPKICVVTDGGDGSYAYDASNQGIKFYKCGVLPVDSFERTGAGDAFGSGCLSAIIKGKDINEALMWGTVNSASVIGYVGAQKGLLTEKDIPVWLERARSSGVKVEEM